MTAPPQRNAVGMCFIYMLSALLLLDLLCLVFFFKIERPQTNVMALGYVIS